MQANTNRFPEGHPHKQILSVKGFSAASDNVISVRRTWELIKDRKIATVKFGRRVGIPASELTRLMEENLSPSINAEEVAKKMLNA